MTDNVFLAARQMIARGSAACRDTQDYREAERLLVELLKAQYRAEQTEPQGKAVA